MRILFAICSWGYGHVARSLPVLRKLLNEGHEVTCVSSGMPIYMLRQELGERGDLRITEFKDVFLPYHTNWIAFATKFILHSPAMFKRIREENAWTRKECSRHKYDIIISDNRYGFYRPGTPSFLISHQLRMAGPGQLGIFSKVSEAFVYIFRKCFNRFIIPDFEQDGVAGNLCHDLTLIDKKKLAYIGTISDLQPMNEDRDLTGYISVTGPEPMRTRFERLIRPQLKDLDGNWFVSLGTKRGPPEYLPNGVTITPYLSQLDRSIIMNRAKVLVSRSGYTTMMDLSHSGQKALLVPTPGQPEQEYLSAYHNQKGTWFSVTEDRLDISKQVKTAHKFQGIKRGSTDKAVTATMDILFDGSTGDS